jgi:hypothetical protein
MAHVGRENKAIIDGIVAVEYMFGEKRASMSDDQAVLRRVRAAFAECERPEHFTNYTHCDECAEHDELLRSRDADTLRIADVGNPGWDPLCYVDAVGFGYFFPGLARLALDDPDPEYGWYVPQLLFPPTNLNQEGVNRHLRDFSHEQRRAVVALLQRIVETRPHLADDYLCSNDLICAIDLWSAEPEPGAAAAGGGL